MKNVEDIYPLSPLQGSLLSHGLTHPGSGVGFQQVAVTLVGPLDAGAFRSAWERVVARHPVLRTAFAWRKLERPMQVVRASASLPFREEDWRDLPEAERETRFRELLARDVAEGFELDRAPLMRCALIRMEDERHRFVWSYHHLILDGWCQSQVLAEVQALYAAMAGGEPARLPERRPYRDYVAWLSKRDPGESEAYWRERLAGLRAPTPLGVDRPYPEPPGDGPAPPVRRLEAEAAPDLVAGLRDLARRTHVTLNTLVQGALAVLLARYSGRRDVLFGTSVSGRPAELPGVGGIIGMFLNNLPLRLEVPPDAKVLDWLPGVQARHAELRQHEHTPLEKVQEWSGLPGAARPFDVLLTFENLPAPEAAAGGEATRGAPRVEPLGEFQASGYPVNLLVAPDDVLSQTLDFDPRRLRPDVARRLLGHFGRLLRAFVETPEARLGELTMLTEDELDAARDDRRAGTVVVDGHGRIAPRGLVGPVHARPDVEESGGGAPDELGSAWRATGEVGRGREDGGVEVLGRADERIERRDLSCAAGEVEALLARHPAVAEAVVVQPEVDGPVTAFYVPDGDAAPPRELRRWTSRRLPAWMVPVDFRETPTPLRGEGDRLDRGALRAAAAEGPPSATVVPPADGLERSLLEVWEEVFDLSPLGVTEDFFELGGHSLLAVRLAARVEEVAGRPLPLGALMERRTVRGLAEHLRSDEDGAASPLVALQPAGDRPPFFCVHPVGGHVLCYEPLARALGPDWPFFGLAAPGLEELPGEAESVEAMAERYVEALEARQGDGPCLVGGWSFGGVVAFEMARRLRARGRRVGLLAIFDTTSPSVEGTLREDDYAAQMAGLAREHAWQHGQEIELTAEDLRGLERRDQLARILEILRRERLVAPEIDLDWLARFAAGHRARLEARLRYDAVVYEGTVTLFRATELDEAYASDLSDEARKNLERPDLGWSALATEPVDVRPVPGTHGTMMAPPSVAGVAKSLRRALEEALDTLAVPR